MIQKVKGGYQVLSSKGKHSAVPIRLLKPRRNGCGKWSFSSIAKDSSPRNKCRGAGHGGAKRSRLAPLGKVPESRFGIPRTSGASVHSQDESKAAGLDKSTSPNKRIFLAQGRNT